jgi:UDPglucose 6-dehydrogenase
LVDQGIKQQRLHFLTDMNEACQGAQVILIAVGTPTSMDSDEADLSYVYTVAQNIAQSLTSYAVIVTKSTVPVGTAKKVVEIIKKTRPDLKEGKDFDVASNPEFLREGSAINDFLRPDRIVVGTTSKKAKELLQQLYRPLYLIETPIVFTSVTTAELSKYASNAFLAVRIGFMNEMANLCEQTDADIQDIAKIMGLDGRIGPKFLHPGPGYGGSCFPKDTKALRSTGQRHHIPLTIVDATIESNEKRKKEMAQRITHIIQADHPTPKKVAILGITFKPNTDDLRDSPSLTIIPWLLRHQMAVHIYDPLYNANNMPLIEHHQEILKDFKGVTWCRDPYETMKDADGVVIITEWNEFRALDLERMAALLCAPKLIDLRNIYKTNEIEGLCYYSIGRTPVLLNQG